METFPQRLLAVIQASGLNRPAFAAKAGVQTSGIAKWLAGSQMPKSEQLLAIAQTAGVTMEWLLTGKGPRTYEAFADAVDGFMAKEGYPKATPAQRAATIQAAKERDAAFPLQQRAEAAERRAAAAEKKLAEVTKLFIALNKTAKALTEKLGDTEK